MPKLSVVMSVYNGEAFIVDAINDILKQTYRDFEFILINDGSKDGSLAIMQDYAAKDDRIRIIDQENTGLTLALRRGVDEARGDYIARMDVDDQSLPTRFEKQMALIAQQPDLVAVTTDVEHFYDDGSHAALARYRHDPGLLPLFLFYRNAIGGHGQMIYSRKAYQEVGGYDPDYNFAEDYDLWTRLADIGPFGNVPEVLYRYRTGHDSISSLNNVRQAEVVERIMIRQYKKITGLELTKEEATGIRLFFLHADPEETPADVTWRLPLILMRAVNAFFDTHPSLSHEKSRHIWLLASRWWWRRKEFSSFSPKLRAIALGNAARLALASFAARSGRVKASSS